VKDAPLWRERYLEAGFVVALRLSYETRGWQIPSYREEVHRQVA
jgi:hypothetical protein